MKKRNLLFIIVIFLCIGGILYRPGRNAYAEAAEAAGRTEDLKQEIIAAYQNYQTKLDVTAYGLFDGKDSDMLDGVMEEVVNETPYLFYTGREYSKGIVKQSRQIVWLELSYSSSYFKNGVVDVTGIENCRKKIDAAAKKALAVVDDRMTKLEKALVLHDYLIGLVAYDDSTRREARLSEEGALIDHKANCQGYAVAYKLLLERAGIRAECVSSKKMNHMWNLVKIGGNWYHVDVTWDDPVNAKNGKERYGYVLHDSFLVSDAGIRATDHYGFQKGLAVKKKYDNAFWKKIRSAFWYQSGKFLYVSPSGIYTRDGLDTGKPVCLKKLSGSCLVKQTGNRFYLLAENRIYLFKWKGKTLKSVYSPPSSCTLLELKCNTKKLYFRYQKANKVYSKTQKI